MNRTLNGAFALLFAIVIVGCGGDNGGEGKEKVERITQKGSDTMVLLAQKWVEVYEGENPDVQIQVSGGGSGTGIAALLNGTTQIANASRPMNEAEKDQIRQKFGVDPIELAVAKDGLTIYIHPDNPITELSIEQLRGIYNGSIKNWSEVGGPDKNIVLYGRENNSGTYDYFKEHVLEKADFARTTSSLPGTAAVVNAVGKDPEGIGYGGAAYSTGVKIVKLKGTSGEALDPSLENVTTGTYPLARDLYFYLVEEPSGATRKFIDWVLSDEGQKYTSEMEYFPVRAAAGNDAGADADTEDTAAAR
jgi:phosphate transport system substrate-binding protein